MKRDVISMTRNQALRIGALAVDAFDDIDVHGQAHSLHALIVEFEDRDGVFMRYGVFTDGDVRILNDKEG